MFLRPPTSTFFPYTTLFRSAEEPRRAHRGVTTNDPAAGSCPICLDGGPREVLAELESSWLTADRKSTRLNSSHLVISYAVFCLKKKIYKPSVLNQIANDLNT